MNKKLKIQKKKFGGGGGESGWGGQDGCEQRIKVFVKNSKNIYIFFWGGGSGQGGGSGLGGGGGVGFGGVRVDVNREVKFL